MWRRDLEVAPMVHLTMMTALISGANEVLHGWMGTRVKGG